MADGELRPSGAFLMAGALLAIACSVLFFYHLSREEVGSEDQARVLLTVSEMNHQGRWIDLAAGSEGHWNRPPLYIWLVKIVSKLSTKVSTFAARVPGGVSALFLVMLGAFWAYVHANRHPRPDNPDFPTESLALLSGLLIATSPEIFKAARAGTPDSTFMLLSFAALYCFGESIETRRSFYASRPWRHWALAGYFLIGLAMMVKGPIVLLFVLLPYMATCLAYRMYKPDWIHLPGLLLVLAIGGWWYALTLMNDPNAPGIFAQEFKARLFGSRAVGYRPFYFYIPHFAKSLFPWNILAVIVVYRTIFRRVRTPTREIWSWSLLLGFVWLSLVGSKSDDYFLPLAPYVLLLAGDAISQWDFDTRSASAFRGLLWLLALACILAGFPASIWLASDLGMGLSFGLAITGVILFFYRRRSSPLYANWERTLQVAWFVVTIFVAVESSFIRDYIPQKNFLNRNRGFTEQVKAHLPEQANLFIYGTDNDDLYRYYFGRNVPSALSISEVLNSADDDTYVVSDDDVKELMGHPKLAAIVTKIGGDTMRPRAALFKVVQSSDVPTSSSLLARYAQVPPLRLAIIGDSAKSVEEGQDMSKVTKRIDKFNDQNPFHEILVIGDALKGDTRLNRLDFHNSFERPYKKLLAKGVPFHGLLGEQDDSLGWFTWFVTHYPPFQMGGRRYYARDLQGGLVRYYALDAFTLSEENSKKAEQQWQWLEADLRSSAAPWKIVALYRPILSMAAKNKNNETIAKRLLPLLDENHVQIVFWSEEPWYQQVQDPAHFPVFFGAGWSGAAESETFKQDSRLKGAYGDKPGFIVIEISPDEARCAAFDEDGFTVGGDSINRSGGLASGQ